MHHIQATENTDTESAQLGLPVAHAELGKTGLTVGGFREIFLHSFAFLSSVRYRDMPVKSNCGEGVTQREKQRQPRQGCSSVTAREVCVFTGGTTQQSAVSVLRVGVRYSYLQKILNNISKRQNTVHKRAQGMGALVSDRSPAARQPFRNCSKIQLHAVTFNICH